MTATNKKGTDLFIRISARFHPLLGKINLSPFQKAARNFRSSPVLSRTSAALPRDSTLRRTSGSVFEVRRLKRHSLNSMDRPSVKSTHSEPGSYFLRASSMARLPSFSLLLISPLQGKRSMRSPTSSASDLPVVEISSSTRSQGIIPLSQYEKSRK